MANGRVRIGMHARELREEDDVVDALLGKIVSVKMDSPNGDFELIYADGHRIVIDCGYVGARIYVKEPPEESACPRS